MGELANLFEAHLKTIGALISDIQENRTTCVGDPPTLDFFWTKIGIAVQGISKEATSICLIFSTPPSPTAKDCEPLLRRLESVTVALVSIFYSLPLHFGITLKKVVYNAVVDIVVAVQNLTSSIQKRNFSSNKEQLQKTGNIWECCDAFPNLPRDNGSAVLSNINSALGLVKDALQELEEYQEESENGVDDGWKDILQDDTSADPCWTEEDKKIVAPSVGLVKAARACLKKCATVAKSKGGLSPNPQGAAHFDSLDERIERISPAVDNVVSCLYPPIQHSVVIENDEALCSVLKDTLEYLRSIPMTEPTDESWMSFLIQAVDHNITNVRQHKPAD